MSRRPIPNSYWVVPGRFLAGEYPGDLNPRKAIAKVKALLEVGIDQFVDLTHPWDRMEPYANLALRKGLEGDKRVVYLRHPIVDESVPIPQEMAHVLDAIDTGLERGRSVYVHCWGGVGRTGTVVGCWLVRNRGVTGEEALRLLAQRWQTVAKTHIHPRSPQTNEQHRFVREWVEPPTVAGAP